MIYLDGELLKEGGYLATDFSGKMANKKVDGTEYYGATLADITGTDIGEVKGVFLQAADGFITYIDNAGDVFIASHTLSNNEYKAVSLDDKDVFGAAAPEAIFNRGIANVYMVTTSAAFEVDIKKDGELIGTIKLADFLKKTPVGDDKKPTVEFDGSFMYNSGSATYEGKFLGMDYDMLITKLKTLNIDVTAPMADVEFYGTLNGGSVGKNTEFSTDPDNGKYYGLLSFFCMFDGMTYNSISADTPIGLTAFISGTGSRWMVYNLTEINFITAPAATK